MALKISGKGKRIARAASPPPPSQEGLRHGRASPPRRHPVRPAHLRRRSSTTATARPLASASTLEADLRAFDGDKTAKARKVGELVAERAKAAGVDAVVFDRGGNKYHGRVAAVADGAREGGLNL